MRARREFSEETGVSCPGMERKNQTGKSTVAFLGWTEKKSENVGPWGKKENDPAPIPPLSVLKYSTIIIDNDRDRRKKCSHENAALSGRKTQKKSSKGKDKGNKNVRRGQNATAKEPLVNAKNLDKEGKK